MGVEVATSKTLCDCDSGKLFKDCHLLLSLPKDSFLVNITKKVKTMKHFAVINGKEQELDAIIEMETTFTDPKPWDNEIINIIKLSQKIKDRQKVFEKRTGKLRHKLDALKYHLYPGCRFLCSEPFSSALPILYVQYWILPYILLIRIAILRQSDGLTFVIRYWKQNCMIVYY